MTFALAALRWLIGTAWGRSLLLVLAGGLAAAWWIRRPVPTETGRKQVDTVSRAAARAASTAQADLLIEGGECWLTFSPSGQLTGLRAVGSRVTMRSLISSTSSSESSAHERRDEATAAPAVTVKASRFAVGPVAILGDATRPLSSLSAGLGVQGRVGELAGRDLILHGAVTYPWGGALALLVAP